MRMHFENISTEETELSIKKQHETRNLVFCMARKQTICKVQYLLNDSGAV